MQYAVNTIVTAIYFVGESGLSVAYPWLIRGISVHLTNYSNARVCFSEMIILSLLHYILQLSSMRLMCIIRPHMRQNGFT